MSPPSVPKPFWSKAGEPATYPNPQVPTLTSTGEETQGDLSVLNTHNNDRASRIPARAPQKTAFARSAMGMGESLGARNTISPSDKIPQIDAQSTLAGSLRTVSGGKGRNRGGFQSGQSE